MDLHRKGNIEARGVELLESSGLWHPEKVQNFMMQKM